MEKQRYSYSFHSKQLMVANGVALRRCQPKAKQHEVNMIWNPVLAIHLHFLKWETIWSSIYKLRTHFDKTTVLLPATRTQYTPISV